MGKLTATQVKNTKFKDEIEKVIQRQKQKARESGKKYIPGKRPTEAKLSDGGGLHLLIKETGKYWRFNYRFLDQGKARYKTLALGVYPNMSLAEARESHREAQNLLKEGIDPSEYKKRLKEARFEASENSFQALAVQFISKQAWTDGHRRTVDSRLTRDIYPYIGARPVSEVEASDILAICRRIEDRGAIESTHRARSIIGQVMRFAVALGLAERDPTRDLKGALSPVQAKHMAAITDPKDIAGLMRSIYDFNGSPVVRAALKMAALTFVRPR